MPSKIRVLDEITINQIAAGEVIESPASCLKELLENALDAGATDIKVETLAAGRALIRVTDNGSGMEGDDLFLCIERHATSKIQKTDDLSHLNSLGFRGEALPSIASISKMRLASAPTGDQKGMELKVIGGKILSNKPLSRNKGTTVEVRDLFFNVPVRKEFSKTLGGDKTALFSVLLHFALCHPQIGLTWICDGKKELALTSVPNFPSPVYDLRIEKLLGEETFRSFRPLSVEENTISISGFIAHPSSHKANRKGQYLFINSRPVVSRFISSCIQEGYSTRLPTNRYPQFLLHFTLPPRWVDANVHPQKKEVRLSEQQKLREAVLKGIERGLAIPSLATSFSAPVTNYTKPCSFLPSVSKEPIKRDPVLFQEAPQIKMRFGRYIFVEGRSLGATLPEVKDDMVLVDELAARRRIFFSSAKSTPSSQKLLMPVTLELSVNEYQNLLSEQAALEGQGFSFRDLSGRAFALDAIPAAFEREEACALIKLLLEEMKGKKDKNRAALLTLCRSIKTKSSSDEEAKWVVKKLLECKDLLFCPLGKPTLTQVSEEKITKLFR